MNKASTGSTADSASDAPVVPGGFTRRKALGVIAGVSGGVAVGGASALAAINQGLALILGDSPPADRLGSVATAAKNVELKHVNINDFGAIGDGTFRRVAEWIIPGAFGRFANFAELQVKYPFVTDKNWSIDRAAIQAAHNASKTVDYPNGRYHLGNNGTGENFIDLSNAGHGVSIRTGNAVELICNTTANVIPAFFYLFNNSGFRCGAIHFRDLGYNPLVDWRGAAGFHFDTNNTATGNWGDISIDSIYAKNCVHTAYFTGGDARHRISGFRCGAIYADNCYYGFSCQNQGDDVDIGKIVAVQNFRPYFVYGCVSHTVNIFNRNNRLVSGAINISRSPRGLDTKRINITYTAIEQTQRITHVLINHVDLRGGQISDIRLQLDIKSRGANYFPVRFVNYVSAGGAETSQRSANQVSNIEISGSCDERALPITVNASYANKRPLKFKGSSHLKLDASVIAKFSPLATDT